ncbi:hypothetical protein ACS126_03150 [Sphingobacterium lactis]|uniref:hypothetical protein n=1 Tax=Sphingobacterium TaxID=28453 RepID=UPI0021A77DDC|nr:hypothetical protein [Sphingobacterium hotanense]MCT1526971.1 hypothetical protein [Sphingobacterium hotanense]
MNDNLLISRIDRAVADNIKDVQRSFPEDAGIVLDFIIFITRKLQTDLFGFTRFTLQQFCRETGRNRQDLAVTHPLFEDGKKKPPTIQGYPLKTVMDYALYRMMERNIVFSNRYDIMENGTTIHMHSFPILKDLRLNFDRRGNELKVYDVRLSDELLSGFLSRYYTVNTEVYKRSGKGRGGDSRKKLLIYLSKIHHVLMSMNGPDEALETTVPIDRLCEFADVTDAKPSHRKQGLTRILENLRVQGGFLFSFEFVRAFGTRHYGVKLTFPHLDKQRLLQEHYFFRYLTNGLKAIFKESESSKWLLNSDSDPFQQWISDNRLDIQRKAEILCKSYHRVFNKKISQAQAINLIYAGQFLTV